MKKFFMYVGIVFTILIVGSVLAGGLGFMAMKPKKIDLKEPSVLHLELKGMITGQEEIVDHLIKYRDDENIKGVIIEIDSPGGVVGPSQEIYSEIKRVRDEFQKPVVVSCNALAASGAYYAAVAADKIVTNPGTLMGSIGVIMNFANMEKLYEWAKVSMFSITTGAYKDSGAPYRSMREDEKALFQDMINGVQDQFKEAVINGRKLKAGVVDQYADGRIFHGKWAVENGFADKLGTFEDARRMIGEMTGLGDKVKLFKPLNEPKDFMEWLNQNSQSQASDQAAQLVKSFFQPELVGKPLFLMPGVLGQK